MSEKVAEGTSSATKLNQVSADNQEANEDPEQNNNLIVQHVIFDEPTSADGQPQWIDGREGNNVNKKTADSSTNLSLPVKEETTSANPANQRRQGYRALRMRADNHPDVERETKAKRRKPNQANTKKMI